MNLADHPFVPYHSDSTHSRRSCRDCGLVPEVHPAPLDVDRDELEERKVKEYALSLAPHLQAGIAHGLTSLSHERAHNGPIRNLDTRDFYRDSEEEKADDVNYAVWNIRQIDRLDGDHEEERMAMIAYLVGLYENWQQLQVAKAAARR